MASPPPAADRGRRLDHQQRAYELQLAGGLHGMARWTVYGLVSVGLAHHFLPTFRKQTLALKAFLVSSSTIIGLCLGADDYLLRFEAGQREQENAFRREARNALAKRGIIATESEIRKWRAEKAVQLEEQAALAVEAADIAEVEGVEAGHVARLRVAQAKESELAKDRREEKGGVMEELKRRAESEQAESEK